MAAGGNTDQIAYIVQAGCLKPLCDLLVVKETKIVSVILEAITNILHVSSLCVCKSSLAGRHQILLRP